MMFVSILSSNVYVKGLSTCQVHVVELVLIHHSFTESSSGCINHKLILLDELYVIL